MNKEQLDPIAEARKHPTFKIRSMFYRIKYKILIKVYNMIVGCDNEILDLIEAHRYQENKRKVEEGIAKYRKENKKVENMRWKHLTRIILKELE